MANDGIAGLFRLTITKEVAFDRPRRWNGRNALHFDLTAPGSGRNHSGITTERSGIRLHHRPSFFYIYGAHSMVLREFDPEGSTNDAQSSRHFARIHNGVIRVE